MPRLRLIGRNSALCDVILLVSLISLGVVFIIRYADITRRNSEVTSHDKGFPVESPGIPADSQRAIEDVLGRVPDSRSAVCRSRKYESLAVATVLVVFYDYEFYDAKLTVISILRDRDLPQSVTEILLVDDASSRPQVLKDAQNYIRESDAMTSHPGVRLVRLPQRLGRIGARSLAVERHVTSDVVVCVDAGVVCGPGWLAPLIDLVTSDTDGQTTIAVPHYDHLTHPVTLEYAESSSDLVATLSWSLTIRMQRHDTGDKGDALSRTVPVLRGEVFAVRRTFLSSIGGLYDRRLEYGTGAAEHIDLSLRTWLCGGSIKVRYVVLVDLSFQLQISFLLGQLSLPSPGVGKSSTGLSGWG